MNSLRQSQSRTEGVIRTARMALFVSVGLLIGSAVVFGQTVTGEGFYDIEELEQLIEVARESGFSEKEIRAITIEDDGEVINAWDFLQERKEREAALAKRERERREKVYLTVKEIVNDLTAEREGELSDLRDESLFVE